MNNTICVSNFQSKPNNARLEFLCIYSAAQGCLIVRKKLLKPSNLFEIQVKMQRAFTRHGFVLGCKGESKPMFCEFASSYEIENF
jgi:hypothetical protein